MPEVHRQIGRAFPIRTAFAHVVRDLSLPQGWSRLFFLEHVVAD